jgi:hypothetical protein
LSGITWARQLDLADELAERYGEGPAMRRARRRLEAGELLDRHELGWRFAEEAKRDGEARARQERLREEYLGWREQRARQLAKGQGIAARLRNGPKAFLDKVDRSALRFCRSCEEIAYPDPKRTIHERGADRDVAGHCHFCGSEELTKIEPAADEGGEP